MVPLGLAWDRRALRLCGPVTSVTFGNLSVPQFLLCDTEDSGVCKRVTEEVT